MDVSIAFGEMDFGANAGRRLAEGCLARCERLPGLLFDHRTSEDVCVTNVDFREDLFIEHQNGLGVDHLWS
jgi:hypothetical protein